MNSALNTDMFIESAYRQIAYHLGVSVGDIPPYIADTDRARIEGVTAKTLQHRRWSGKDSLPSIKRGRVRATMTVALAQSMADQARTSTIA